MLRPARPKKADLFRVDVGDGPMVVKDFSRRSRFRRLVGRIQVGRETRAYARLGAVDGVPRFIGRIDAHALALELVPCEEFTVLRDEPERAPVSAERALAELQALIGRLHEAGVVHMDLRGKGNVQLRPDGRPLVVDLAASVVFRPGSLGHRLLFRAFALADRTGFLKWRARIAPHTITPAERRVLRRFRFVRKLWVFNLRHRRPAPSPIDKR